MRLAPDQAPALERRQLAGHAGGRDAEALGEVEAPEPPVGSGVQLEQQREIVEPEAVMAFERGVDVAHDDGAGVGQLEDGRESGGGLGGGHAAQHIIDVSLICRSVYQAASRRRSRASAPSCSSRRPRPGTAGRRRVRRAADAAEQRAALDALDRARMRQPLRHVGREVAGTERIRRARRARPHSAARSRVTPITPALAAV